MHEMSIVASLLDIVRDELTKHGAHKLELVRVCFGPLTNIVPEALEFGFEAMTKGTEFDGATLEMKKIPLTVACGECGTEFSPENTDMFYMPCPECGREFAHKVLSGNELYVDHIEAE